MQALPRTDPHVMVALWTYLQVALEFIAVKLRIVQAQKNTGERDALISVTGTLLGRPVVASAFEFRFMGGSMGSVVGERFARAARHAAENKMPLINAYGNTRMFENYPKDKLRYIFVSYPDYQDEGEFLTKWAYKNLGSRKFAIFYQNDDYGKLGWLGMANGVG